MPNTQINDARLNALQNSKYKNWQDAYAEYSGRRGSNKERREFKKDWRSQDNVKARIGEDNYNQLRAEAEQRQFGVQGYNSGSAGERRRFDRRFDKNVSNGNLRIRQTPQTLQIPQTLQTPRTSTTNGTVIYPWMWDTYQVRPRGGMFSQFFVPTTPVTPVAPVTPKSNTDWEKVAKDNGFENMAHVKAWQEANGLVADGKFGDNSMKYWKQHSWGKYNPQKEDVEEVIEEVVETPKTQYYYVDEDGNRYSYVNNKLTKLTQEQTKDWESKGSLKDMDEFRNAVNFAKKDIKFGGLTFKNPYYFEDLFRYTENAPDWNQSGWGENARVRVKDIDGVFPLRIWNNQSWAIDTEKGLAYELPEDFWGEVDGRGNDEPLRTLSLYSFYDDYDADERKRLKSKKQGGKMNKTKYFQQGGAVPQQQDVQQQIIQLVQAAMQGDQQATQTIQQVMQAAEQGDQQAQQLAQMIQQVAEQMKGQATMAKWGSKLKYIKSLKYAKGGKTCLECQQGGDIFTTRNNSLKNPLKKSINKVEEKACGGKTKKIKK